jgi:hypothetical protein
VPLTRFTSGLVRKLQSVFITFSSIDRPRSIFEEEARWLVDELLRPPTEEDALGLVTPLTEQAAQAALKIQHSVERAGHVKLAEDEHRAVLKVLVRAAQPGEIITERLRWLQVGLQNSLGIEAH